MAIVLVPSLLLVLVAASVVTGARSLGAQGCNVTTRIYAVGVNKLLAIFPDVGSAVPIATIPDAFSVAASDEPDTLYVTTTTGLMYRFKISTGMLSLIGPGVANNSLTEGHDGFQYKGLANGDLIQVDTATGVETFIGNGGQGYAGDIAAKSFSEAYGAVGSPILPPTMLAAVDLASGGTNNIANFTTPLGQNPGPVLGLAFTADGRFWAIAQHPMTAYYDLYLVDPATATSVFKFTIEFPIWDLASQVPCAVPTPFPTEPAPDGDLGDAPDSTNHAGQAMTTYPSAITAHFPTVFDLATGSPAGPMHFSPSDSSLGSAVSQEVDADQVPDADTVTNIEPVGNDSNQDGDDDGINDPVSLPHCEMTQVSYDLTISGGATSRYVNVWFDFNGDGDWGDSLTCSDPTRGPVSLSEWSVRNQLLSYGAGNYTVQTPQFRAYDRGSPMWMRITLSGVAASSVDGHGPSGGYGTGETEDYYLTPVSSGVYAPE
jgi:hypothetical protein